MIRNTLAGMSLLFVVLALFGVATVNLDWSNAGWPWTTYVTTEADR